MKIFMIILALATVALLGFGLYHIVVGARKQYRRIRLNVPEPGIDVNIVYGFSLLLFGIIGVISTIGLWFFVL